MLCSVRPCDRQAVAKGMCKSHYNRAHYAANRDQAKARSKAWYHANPAKAAAARARRDPETLRQQYRRWYAENRLRALVKSANQRARNVGAAGVLTVEGVLARFDYFGHRCWICRQAGADSPDHVIALGAGGPNFNSNIRPAHKSCNFGHSWKGRAS